MALHTRYPGHNGHQPQPGSPLGRVVDVINQVSLAQGPLCAGNPINEVPCQLAKLYTWKRPGHGASKAACQPMKRSGCSMPDKLFLSHVCALKYLRLQVFRRCNSTACLPRAAVSMIDYWRADHNMTEYAPVAGLPPAKGQHVWCLQPGSPVLH